MATGIDKDSPLRRALDALVIDGALQFQRGRFDLPAIVFPKNREPIALLEETKDGSGWVTGVQGDGRTEMPKAELPAADVTAGASFSITYANTSDEMQVGSAPRFERGHWLFGSLKSFWRSYARVVLAAVFINVLGLVSPIFVMNVYDRILPNKAIASLWVLAIGVSLAILFDLLLKTARAALIDSAGHKADLKISYLLFEKVLNTALANGATRATYDAAATQTSGTVVHSAISYGVRHASCRQSIAVPSSGP